MVRSLKLNHNIKDFLVHSGKILTTLKILPVPMDIIVKI